MNESAPPLPQWLLLRDTGIGKPALIVKFKFTIGPSDPCHDRDRVKSSAKTIFRFGQVGVEAGILQFAELAIVNVRVDSIPLEKISPVVAERRPTKQKPAIFSIEAPQACFVFGWLGGGQGCPPVVVQARQVIRMNGSSPTVTQQLLLREPGIGKPALIWNFNVTLCP